VKAKKLISLILTEINNHYGISKAKFYVKNDKKQMIIFYVIIVSIAITLISIIPLYKMFMENMLISYAMLGIKEMFISSAILYSGIFGLVIGLFVFIGEFFFTKNMPLLISLPLKPWEVITAKLTTVILDQLIISLCILLPHLIFYGVKTDVGVSYWIYAIFIFIFSQMFTVTLVMAIILPLSRLIKFSKNRDFWMFFSSIIILLIILIVPIFINQNTFSTSNIQEIMSNPDSILNNIAKTFPPAFIGTKALSGGGFSSFGYTIFYVIFNMFFYLLCIFMGNKFYYKTYMDLQEKFRKKENISADDVKKLFNKQSNVKKSLLIREWKYFLKVPAFSVNGFANILILPLLISIFALTSKFAPSEDIKMLFDFFEIFYDYAIPIGVLIALGTAGLNGLAFSPFSREGKLLTELKMLPVSEKNVLVIKLIQINTFSFISIIFSTIFTYVIFQLNFFETVFMFIVSIISVFAVNILQMFVDALNPSLKWENPQKAMKQNFNALFSILIAFAYVFLLGFLMYKSLNILSQKVVALIFLIISLSISVIFWNLLLKATKRLFEKD